LRVNLESNTGQTITWKGGEVGVMAIVCRTMTKKVISF